MFGGVRSGITSLRRIIAQHESERLIQRMGSSSMKHCQSTLLWLARTDLGSVMWAVTTISSYTASSTSAGRLPGHDDQQPSSQRVCHWGAWLSMNPIVHIARICVS